LSSRAFKSVDRCGLGVACAVAVGRFAWSFPFEGSSVDFDPEDVPRFEFLIVFSIQLVETEVLR
jgi:glucokinase